MQNNELSLEDFKGTNIEKSFKGSSLSSEMDEWLEKGKALPIGTKKNYNGKPYIKTANGWRPEKKGGKGEGAEEGKAKEAKYVSPKDADPSKMTNHEYYTAVVDELKSNGIHEMDGYKGVDYDMVMDIRYRDKNDKPLKKQKTIRQAVKIYGDLWEPESE